jgi:hypothetical protein
MKSTSSSSTLVSSRLIRWGRWLQTSLLVVLLLLLFQRLNLLPPLDDSPPAAGVQHQPTVQQVNWDGR